MQVHGIGKATAERLCASGIFSVAQLRESQSQAKTPQIEPLIKLTQNQLLGLKYFDDFQKKIPHIG